VVYELLIVVIVVSKQRRNKYYTWWSITISPQVFSRDLDSTSIKQKLEALSNVSSIPINPENVTTSDSIVAEVKNLIELVCTIKIWGRFGMPKAEEAHTFECSVKNDIIQHLQALESSG